MITLLPLRHDIAILKPNLKHVVSTCLHARIAAERCGPHSYREVPLEHCITQALHAREAGPRSGQPAMWLLTPSMRQTRWLSF